MAWEISRRHRWAAATLVLGRRADANVTAVWSTTGPTFVDTTVCNSLPASIVLGLLHYEYLDGFFTAQTAIFDLTF